MVNGFESQFFENVSEGIILAAAPAPGGGGEGTGGDTTFILVMVLMFVGMYFLLFAPQRKKQKQHAKMVSNLKSGDEVLTIGGIYGTVTNVKNERVVVRIAENTKIEVNRHSVQSVVTGNSDDNTSVKSV